MASDKNILIQGTEQLARGELDNVALSGGSVILEDSAGRYVPFGCYTTPVFPIPVSEEVLVSWNADTPEETVVETQARVLVRDNWSPWFSFGKWSPYLHRQGEWQEKQADPYVRGGRIVIPGRNAVSIQLRTYLYTNDDSRTPALRLLAASVKPKLWSKSEGRPVNRDIRLPAYSQLCRDPAFAGELSGPTTLAALMNRFGQDILPEEVAMVSQDEAPGAREENAAFYAAAAGCYGYPAWQAWLDLAGLREEIRQGNPVMARVEYAGRPEDEKPGMPWIEGVTGTATDHWLAVHGFLHDSSLEEDYVIVCDPLSGTDYGAERRYRMDSFLKAFTGMCLLMRRRPRDSGQSAPERLCCELREAESPNSYFFYRAGENLPLTPGVSGAPTPVGEEAPAAVPAEEAAPRAPIQGILACTLLEGKAYATTAHKHFRFDLTVNPDGSVKLPETICEKGRRVTVYAVDAFGRMKVAEKIL